MPTNPTANDHPEYINGPSACKLVRTNSHRLLALAVKGKIRTRLDRFERIMYRTEDVLLRAGKD